MASSCSANDNECHHLEEQGKASLFTKDFWRGAWKDLKNQGKMLLYGAALSGAGDQGVDLSQIAPPELESPANPVEEAGMAFSEAMQLAVGGFEAMGASQTINLFRAVQPAELAQIGKTGTFVNPVGIEVKYFSPTIEGAEKYAAQAAKAFGDGPYTIVRTSIPKSAITTEMRAVVDRGIPTVTVPTKMLPQLVKPRILR